MTRPGIEPRSPGPLANTLTAGPMSPNVSMKKKVHIKLLYSRYEGDTTYLKNISSPFIYESCGEMTLFRERKSRSRTVNTDTKLWYISREISFFVPLSWEADTTREPPGLPYGLTHRRYDSSTLLTEHRLPNWPLGLKTSVNFAHILPSGNPPMQFSTHTQFTWHLCCPFLTLKHSCTSCHTNWPVKVQ